MKIVYPTNHHKTFASATFAIGSVNAEETLWLNGQSVNLSAKGYFSQYLPLGYGENTFNFKASGGETRQLVIFRNEPLRVAVGTIAPQLLPTPDMVLMPGDLFTLKVAAGAGQDLKAQLTLPGGQVLLEMAMTALGKSTAEGLADNRTAQFAELTQTSPPLPKACVYQATAQLPTCIPPAEKVILRWVSHTLTLDDTAQMAIWDRPRFGQITADTVVMRTSPPEGSRLSPQRQGAWVVITGKQGDWWRVRLSGEKTAWLPVNKVSVVIDTPQPVAQIPAQTLKTQPVAGKNHSVIQLPGLPHPVPFTVDSHPNGLTIDYYGVVSHCDFIHYDPQEKVISQIDWSQPNADTFRLAVTVPRLCGYQVSFDNADSPKASLLIKQLDKAPRILIDPGHGGAETGSIGPDGTPEKNLNLSLSLLVANACRQQGLDITLTRESDRAVSLTDRTTLAEGFDMVISLHHNALPDGRDPLKAQGLSVYYYHGLAKPLAQSLCTGLSQTLRIPNFGVFYDSLALTRIPQAMAVLIETGFMTHPTEFERLQTPAFQQAFAQALAQQLIRFINR